VTSQQKLLLGVALTVTGTVAQLVGSGILSFAGALLGVIGWFFIVARLAAQPATHWKTFNIATRLVGCLFTLGGMVALGSAVYEVFHPGARPVTETLTGSRAIDGAAFGGLFLAVGLIFVLKRSYRPDLGDAAFSDRIMRLLWGLPRNWATPVPPGRESRTWWTGESRATSARASQS
jgi:hypothetical protein